MRTVTSVLLLDVRKFDEGGEIMPIFKAVRLQAVNCNLKWLLMEIFLYKWLDIKLKICYYIFNWNDFCNESRSYARTRHWTPPGSEESNGRWMSFVP